jgi:hypothetical protein
VLQAQQVQPDHPALQGRLVQTEKTGLTAQPDRPDQQDLRVVMVQQDLRALLPDSAHLQPQPDLLALPQADRTHQRFLPSLSLPVRPDQQDPMAQPALQGQRGPPDQQALPVQQVAQDPKV